MVKLNQKSHTFLPPSLLWYSHKVDAALLPLKWCSKPWPPLMPIITTTLAADAATTTTNTTTIQEQWNKNWLHIPTFHPVIYHYYNQLPSHYQVIIFINFKTTTPITTPATIDTALLLLIRMKISIYTPMFHSKFPCLQTTDIDWRVETYLRTFGDMSTRYWWILSSVWIADIVSNAFCCVYYSGLI